MLNYEEIYKIVENKLSEQRFYHSKCVVQRCVEYAKIYGADIEKIKIAGIAHDVAKEVPEEQRIEMAERYGVQLDKIEKQNTHLIHAKLGAAMAKKDFGCSDDICEAIRWHTTGKENMSLMDKIVYIADMTGEDRKSDTSKKLYHLSKENLDEAILESIKFSLDKFMKKNQIIHLDTIKTFNDIISKKDRRI